MKKKKRITCSCFQGMDSLELVQLLVGRQPGSLCPCTGLLGFLGTCLSLLLRRFQFLE